MNAIKESSPMKSPVVIQEQNDVMQVVSYAELHSPIRFEGATETHVSKLKLKTLKTAYWNKEGMLVIIGARETHMLPGAAVKDSII